jgi:Zn finger protein HypA/HybF involved in hydrogenase expression
VAGHHGVTGNQFHFARMMSGAFCLKCDQSIEQEAKCPFCGGGNIQITAGLNTIIQEVSSIIILERDDA